MNPITVKIVGFLIVAGLLFGGGFEYEHVKFVAYKAEQKGVAEQQVQVVKNLNKTIDTNAKDSNETIVTTAKSIHDYYVANPVTRVLHVPNTSACPLPETNSSASSVNATTTNDYASPYSPLDTEIVANQLDQLQKLLTKDGVTVK